MRVARSALALLVLAVVLTCSACGGTSRDALIAAAEHRVEDARARRGSGGGAAGANDKSGDESAFEIYAAEEHLAEARAAREGRAAGGVGEARDAFSRAEQAAVLPR